MSVHVSPWYDVSRTFMTSVWPWPLTSISKLYFHHEFEYCKIVIALWHRHFEFWHMGVSSWDFTCCVHSWPLYDLDLWPICGGRWISLVSFAHSFYLVSHTDLHKINIDTCSQFVYTYENTLHFDYMYTREYQYHHFVYTCEHKNNNFVNTCTYKHSHFDSCCICENKHFQ